MSNRIKAKLVILCNQRERIWNDYQKLSIFLLFSFFALSPSSIQNLHYVKIYNPVVCHQRPILKIVLSLGKYNWNLFICLENLILAVFRWRDTYLRRMRRSSPWWSTWTSQTTSTSSHTRGTPSSGHFSYGLWRFKVSQFEGNPSKTRIYHLLQKV